MENISVPGYDMSCMAFSLYSNLLLVSVDWKAKNKNKNKNAFPEFLCGMSSKYELVQSVI